MYIDVITDLVDRIIEKNELEQQIIKTIYTTDDIDTLRLIIANDHKKFSKETIEAAEMRLNFLAKNAKKIGIGRLVGKYFGSDSTVKPVKKDLGDGEILGLDDVKRKCTNRGGTQTYPGPRVHLAGFAKSS